MKKISVTQVKITNLLIAVEGGGLKKIPLFDQHTNTRLIGQCVLHSLTAMSGEALMQTAKRMG